MYCTDASASTGTNVMTTAPITHAHTAPGPASCAARQAPNNQPEPMIEPKPVNIKAMAPTSRRMAFSLDMGGGIPGALARYDCSSLRARSMSRRRACGERRPQNARLEHTMRGDAVGACDDADGERSRLLARALAQALVFAEAGGVLAMEGIELPPVALQAEEQLVIPRNPCPLIRCIVLQSELGA